MRMNLRQAGAIALALTPGIALHAQADDYPKLSPYTAIRWTDAGPQPQVRVEPDGDWFEPVSIDDVAVSDVLVFCKKRYAGKWQKRFDEDLVQVLSEMGHPPGKTVKLVLHGIVTDEVKILDAAPLTRANRDAIMAAKYGPEGAGREPPRVRRPHAHAPAPQFAFLAERIKTTAESARLTARAAAADLDQLEWHIEHTYAYAKRADFDYRTALDTIRLGLGDNISREFFALQLHKFMCLFGDGHSGLRAPLARGYTSFLIGDDRGRLFAYKPDRSDFLDPDYPYLLGMDGRPVDEWLAAARRLVAAGSPQFVAQQARRTLRYVAHLRAELGLPAGDTLRVELATRKGGATRVVELPLARRRPLYGRWPRGEAKRLDQNIGYLRIERMDDELEFLDELVAHMHRFRETDGLIIDVRGNSGGSRDALRTLLPFFLPPDAPPRVVNVAAYRLGKDQDAERPQGYLADRLLYPADWPTWTAAQRRAVQDLSAKFKPEWELPAGEFSAWHYLVISPVRHRKYFHYRNPVVVLMDTACFSATDIFLGAFKGLRNVTLLGTPSAGGSGRASHGGVLRHSGLRFRLSSMASFLPDGKLYDGNGIHPDVLVHPQPTDAFGRTDTALEAALRRLRR